MYSLDDYVDQPVPKSEGPRFGWFYLTNVENATTICVPVFVFATFLGGALPLSSLLWALVLSGVLLSLLTGLSSYIGTKTRMSTALLVQAAFGKKGSKIIWGIFSVALLGFFGLQIEIFAKALMGIIGKLFPHTDIDENYVILLSGMMMSLTAVMGIGAVGKVAQIALPFLLGTMIYAFYAAWPETGLDSLAVPTGTLSIGGAMAAIIGAYVVGAITMPDIKRFAVNTKHSVASGVLGIGIIYPTLLLITALTALFMQQSNYVALLLDLGVGPFAMIVLMLATWSTNDLNLYSASLNLVPLFPKVSRSVITAIGGLLGTCAAMWGVFEKMIPLFTFLGVFMTPLLAIYAVHFFKGEAFKGAFKEGYCVPSLSIWAVASVLGIMTTEKANYGLELFQITTVAGLDSLLMAAFLMLVFVGIKRRVSLATC